MLRNFISFVTILLFVLFFQTARAEASEGIVELGSINGSATRCFAMSSLIGRSNTYLLQIQCRNLVYPIGREGMFYILWANPIGITGKENKPIRIGDLEFGKGNFNLQYQFSSLFITKEQIQNPEQPSSNRVMEGGIKSIAFLDREPTPTLIPSPTVIPSQTPESAQKISSQIVTPTPQPKGGWNLLGIMQALGLFIIIIFFIFAIIYFVISRLRKL